ncbi:MAG: cytochrome ubiquinol oxidase subunit I [Halieaceae bacterium]|nr:cytochrome ubiquinol oxidase subunit I [Halieaceae bacterium]
MLRSSLIAAAVLTPTQILIGDLHGLNSFEHQPTKIAAVEAVWETTSGVPFTLMGMPNEKTKTTYFAIKIPKLASLVLVHDAEGELSGLDQFEEEHPPVAAVFWSFRVMVGVAMLMLIMSWYGCWKPLRNSTFSKFYLRLLAPMAFPGWVAVLAGWYVTEIGRQP